MLRSSLRVIALGCLISIVVGVSRAQTPIELKTASREVPQYARADFDLQLAPCLGNPYDPDEIDVHLEIRTPGGKTVELPAFYYQDYERRRLRANQDMKDWLYPVGDPAWKARFAPSEVGTHTCRAVMRCRGLTAESEELTFECTASESRGFVRVCERYPRYLQFSKGGAYFPIGENIAFVKDTYQHQEWLQKLGAAGGNFARIWACCGDWGMSLEGRKSAWGRSWQWDPPIAVMPGGQGFDAGRLCVKLSAPERASVQVSPSHPVALRPQTEYLLSGRARVSEDAQLTVSVGGQALGDPLEAGRQWSPFEYGFTSKPDQWWLGPVTVALNGEGAAWLSDLSLHEAPAGPELLWEADPNRPILGRLNQVDCYMLDTVVEAAERAGVYLQLVLLHRDSYQGLHPSLQRGGRNGPDYDEGIRKARNLLRYAIARWGYSTHVAAWEYFNEIDPEAPTERLYAELGRYLEDADPYRHLRVTSTWAHCPRDWSHSQLDAINLHHYMRPVEGEPWQDEVAVILGQTRKALESQPPKPVMLAEFGLADEKWGLSPYMKQDERLVHLHNSLWVSALSGLAGTVMPWWWDTLDAMDAYPHFSPLAAFVADIPFATTDLRAIANGDPGGDGRFVGLLGEDCAFLWVAHPDATWWKLGIEKTTLPPTRGAEVSVPDLAAGTYRVQWWDTWAGEVVKDDTTEHDGGALSLRVPDFETDVACEITRADGQPQ